MIIQDAAPADIDEVLGRTHALWSDGLDLPAYEQYVATLMQSAWAAQRPRRYRFIVMREDPGGPVVAALKLYRLDLRLEDQVVSTGGVGAVFTMPDHRRRGHAGRLIERVHGMMAERGDRLSLLFTEIGTAYYAARGYRALPDRAVRLAVPATGPEPRGVRRMRKSDIEWIASLRRKEDSVAKVAVVRDRSYWSYLLARASMPTLWLGPRAWESRLMIAPDAGYLWSGFTSGAGGCAARILEAGEREPGAALPALLDELFVECRDRGAASVKGWLTPGMVRRDARLENDRDVPPEEAAGAAVPMWAPLDPEIAPVLDRLGPAAAFHLTDSF